MVAGGVGVARSRIENGMSTRRLEILETGDEARRCFRAQFVYAEVGSRDHESANALELSAGHVNMELW